MRIAALGLLLGTICLAACDDTNDIIIVPLSRTGVFVLQTVDGRPVPTIAVDSVSPPLRIEVLTGSITINANGTFSDAVSFRQTLGGAVTTHAVVCTGSYTIINNTFTFVEATVAPDCGRTFTGVLTGTTLTAPLFGETAVYFR